MEPMRSARIQDLKVNADLLAFEALPNYIAITKTFKTASVEEAAGWQKNA